MTVRTVNSCRGWTPSRSLFASCVSSATSSDEARSASAPPWPASSIAELIRSCMSGWRVSSTRAMRVSDSGRANGKTSMDHAVAAASASPAIEKAHRDAGW